MNLGGKDDLQEGISMRIVSSPNFKGADVEQMKEVMGQPTGLDLIKVATSKIEEGVLGVNASRLDQRLEKAGPSSLKHKSTWTRFN